MGLFDGYQFSDTPQGGLIDRILTQLQQQGAYQPSPGFGDQPNALDTARWPQSPVGGPSDPAAIPQNAQPTQGMLPAAPTGAPMPYQQPQGGLGGAFRGFAANAGNGPIGALLGGIGGAMGIQDAGQQQANQYALQSYQALVPILGEQKARLAVLNPEIGKAMVAQALQGKQYQFTTAPDGTVIRTDAHAGTAEPVYQAGLKPTFGVIGESDGQKTYGWIDPGKRTTTPVSGLEPRSDTVTGPDGKPIAIPPGVDRKEFVKKVSDANAKAATGDKTETQANSEIFANRMELAEKNLKGIDTEGQSFWNRVSEGSGYLPGSATVGRYLQGDKYQAYLQAKNSFISAKLRKESGAAISPLEYEREDKEFFPQPGDGKEVIRQKAEARRVAIEAMKKGAGPGYRPPNFDDAGGKADPLGIR